MEGSKMSHTSHTRRQLPPLASNNKRKEREETTSFDFLKPSNTFKPPPKLAKPLIPRPAAPIRAPKTAAAFPSHPASPPPLATGNSRLLAGYLANEFLTKGSLFGQTQSNPARAEPILGLRPAHPADLRRTMKPPFPSSVYSQKGKAAEPKPIEKKSEPQALKNRRYAEVSALLKGKNGVHIQGVVNPNQLVRLLNLQ